MKDTAINICSHVFTLILCADIRELNIKYNLMNSYR